MKEDRVAELQEMHLFVQRPRMSNCPPQKYVPTRQNLLVGPWVPHPLTNSMEYNSSVQI